jgi:hypothetical protein
MGVTASTPANLVIGAGNVLVDNADQGATSGDNTYSITQEIFEPDLNGIPGALVGTQYKTKEEAVLAATMPEVSAETLALIWTGSGEVDGVIDWDGTRRLPLAAFHDYELRIPGLSRVFRFLADNALNQGSIEFSGQDAGMMAARGEFHSKWSADQLDASPHRIVVEPIGSGS